MEQKENQFVSGVGIYARCPYGCMGCFYCEGRDEPCTKPKATQKPKGWPTLAVIFRANKT